MLPTTKYARTSDGVTIGFAVLGSDGPVLVSMPTGLLSNLLALRRVPGIARGYELLAQRMRVVLYDGRGTGSSQRDVEDVSLDAMVRDLEAVVEHEQLSEFALLGYYFSSMAAIDYAARRPDVVRKLALFGASLRGERMFSTNFSQALITLIDHDWDAAIESATHAWTGWTGSEDERLTVEAYRDSATPEMARKVFGAAAVMDVSGTAGGVQAPTLVIHRHDERQLPLEISEEVAAAIPDARLLRLDGSTGVLFLDAPETDATVLLDFYVGGAPDARSESAVERDGASAGVFLSCSEKQKEALARPFKQLLEQHGLRGFVVSDEPRPDGTWTPEDKVDAYLDMSDAVVVFATADVQAGDDRYTRPNIGDEIGRARAKPHLRDRVCVLKEHGVTLPSNINPAYETLDVENRDEAFGRALAQLRAWGCRSWRRPLLLDNYFVIVTLMKACRALKSARRRAGLSQRALAEKAGVPQPAIARIESGAVSPRIDTLERLLRAAGATLEVAPLAGAGVDRTLIRANLERTPEERIRAAERAALNLSRFLAEAERGKRA